MGALNQLGQAATSFVQNPVGSVSNALAQADKDLSLSQNAPLIAAGTAAYFGAPYIMNALGGAGAAGAAGAGAADLAAYDAMAGLTAGGAGAGAGAGLAGAGLAGAVADPYALSTSGGGLASSAGGAFNPYTAALPTAAIGGGLLNGITPTQALAGANILKNILGGTGMATTAQQQALGSLLGGLLQQTGGLVQGEKSAAAAEEQARLINEATQRGVAGAQFRPIGTTTRFGTSQFQVDPVTGQLVSAGYTVSPELKAMQDRIMALSGQGLTEAEKAAGRYAPLTAGAQGLFGLGQQYLAQTPEQVAADYMAKQQNLLAPSRERQLAQLQNQLFQTGRGGLSVGGTGMRPGGGEGLRAASPEMEAYYNALAQQDAALAAQAQQAGQQQVQFGAGLMGTGANLLGAYGQGLTGAYAPFSTGIGVGSSLEQLGQQPLSLSQQLAQLGATAGGRAGLLGIEGASSAARARLPSMQYSPLANILSGAGGNTQFGNLLGQAAGSAFPSLLGLFSGGTPTVSDVLSAYGGLGDTGYSAADLAGII